MQFSTMSALSSVLAGLGTLVNNFQQNARQLHIAFGGSAADLNASFVVARFSGWEEISEGCEFSIDPLSTTAHTPLKSLMLAPVTLSEITDSCLETGEECWSLNRCFDCSPSS